MDWGLIRSTVYLGQIKPDVPAEGQCAPGFLKLFLSVKLVCVCMCVCISVVIVEQ